MTTEGTKGIAVDERMTCRRLSAWARLEAARTMVLDEAALIGRLARLTDTQAVILACLAHGKLNKQIAHEYGISQATVKSHVSKILKRLNARSRTEAAVKYAIVLDRASKYNIDDPNGCPICAQSRCQWT